MERIQKRADRFCKAFLILFTGICMFYLLLMSMWGTSVGGKRDFSQDEAQTSIQMYNFFFGDHPFFILGIFLLLFLLMWGLLSGINNRTVSLKYPVFLRKYGSEIICLLYLFAGLLFIWNTRLFPISDQYKVMHIAEMIIGGDFSSFAQDGYMHRYPDQNGIVLFYWLMTRLFGENNYMAIQTFNLFALVLAFYVMGSIARMSLGRKGKDTAVIVLYVLFIPAFFYITLVYGTLPGWAFSIFAIYFEIRFLREKKWKFAVCASLLIGLAYIFKTNSIIFFIAMLLVLLYECLLGRDIMRKERLRLAGGAGILILGLLFCGKMTELCMVGITGYPVSEGMPKTVWIAMGLQNSSYAPGTWNGYSVGLYEDCGYDYGLTQERALENIKETLGHFGEDRSYGMELIGRKMAAQWNDPTFQGLSILTGREETANSIAGVVASGRAAEILRGYMNLLHTFVLAGAFLFLLNLRRDTATEEFILLTAFAGGFVFHLFWEAKPMYVMPYYLLLIPYSVRGFRLLFEKADRLCTEIKEGRALIKERLLSKKTLFVAVVFVICTLISIIPVGRRAFSYTIAIEDEAEILSQYEKYNK